MHCKLIDDLSLDDIKAFPIWQFVPNTSFDVVPDDNLPCNDFSDRVIATQVVLADGSKLWSLIGNVDTGNPRSCRHFITLAVHHRNKWFQLARYHDHDYSRRGPQKLSEWLGKPIEQVFPITYDLRSLFNGESSALQGSFEMEPSEKLTTDELIALAIS